MVSIAMALALCMPAAAYSRYSAKTTIGQVIRSIPVAGVSHDRVIVYRSGGLRLGLSVSSGTSSRIVWSRSLPADPSDLTSPGPHGLVQGILRLGNGGTSQFFAYLVRSGHVTSAIDGHPRGQITADEGAAFHGLQLLLRAGDLKHVGSVAYRFDTTFAWQEGLYRQIARVHVPDYAPSEYPAPNAVAQSSTGDITLIRLEIADTEYLRELGLMNRKELDPDSGMIFVWPSDVKESFWMENTYIPLSIAFLAADGTVQEIQDMAPLTTTPHTPLKPYRYAIEANLGFFSDNHIAVGDKLTLNLANIQQGTLNRHR
jgi:uncharacterized membrane protein (UPF0127 family)